MMSFAKAASTNKVSAPLWTWIAAGTFALLFFGISFCWFFRANTFEHFNPKRLESFTCRGGGKTLRVAVIGTSLTRHAFFKDEDMERFARDRGLQIHFLRFTLGGGSLEEFYDLSTAVINSGADVICFEAAIFGLEMGNDNVMLDRYRYYLRHGGTKFLARLPFVPKRHRSENQNENFAETELTTNPVFEQNPEKEKELYLERSSQFRIRDFSEGKKFAPLFLMAKARGKTVVFLDLSRSNKAWDMLPVDFEDEFFRPMRQYEKAYGIPCLRFPYRLPLDYFQDFAHFGPKGRKLYSEWFLANLATLSGDTGK